MTFEEAKMAYQKFLDKNDLTPKDLLRIETHIETMKDWSQIKRHEDVLEWLQDHRQKCSMEVSEISLNDCKDWEFDTINGLIKHKTGLFFTVQGLRVKNSKTREVGFKGWDQPILKETSFNGGIIGIIRQKINSVPHYLVEAKAEPGNPDLVQLSPSLQATFSNIEQSHGGRKPYLLDYFTKPLELGCTTLFDQWMSEDGGRLYNKKNRCMLVQIPDSLKVSVGNTFTWLSLFQIKSLIKQDAIVNPHVRSLISHL